MSLSVMSRCVGSGSELQLFKFDGRWSSFQALQNWKPKPAGSASYSFSKLSRFIAGVIAKHSCFHLFKQLSKMPAGNAKYNGSKLSRFTAGVFAKLSCFHFFKQLSRFAGAF